MSETAPLTSLEEKVRRVLGTMMACSLGCPGHHHYSRQWSRRRKDAYSVTLHFCVDFSTYDGSRLTFLVIGCHEEALRVEIVKSGPGYVGLCFSERSRDGANHERHPTIEAAVETYRSWARAPEQPRGGA